MKQAALAFDDIPVVFIVIRCEPLDRTRHEVGNHSIERNTPTRNQDACLACCAERRFHTAVLHLFVNAERRIHLADRAICTNSQETLAFARLTIGDGVFHFWNTHIMKHAARCFGDGHKISLLAQQVMQARGKVKAFLKCCHQDLFPLLANDPTTIGDPNHERLCAYGFRLFQSHIS